MNRYDFYTLFLFWICSSYLFLPKKIIPHLSGLKQQWSFYYFPWFLWARNLGKAHPVVLAWGLSYTAGITWCLRTFWGLTKDILALSTPKIFFLKPFLNLRTLCYLKRLLWILCIFYELYSKQNIHPWSSLPLPFHYGQQEAARSLSSFSISSTLCIHIGKDLVDFLPLHNGGPLLPGFQLCFPLLVLSPHRQPSWGLLLTLSSSSFWRSLTSSLRASGFH